jgi:hypothetical protein
VHRHLITVQRVPAAIYGREASYPSWLCYGESLARNPAAAMDD